MKTVPHMDGARKIAILLLSLEQSVAADILRKLPKEHVEQVTLSIANAKTITRDEQEQILNEFKIAFATRPLIQPAGPETARELLEQSLDQPDVESAQMRIDDQVQAGPFAFLHSRHPDDIRRLIEDERPQTIAVVAGQLPPHLAAQVLASFAAEVQADILGRLARIGPADMSVLEEIAMLLKKRIGPVPIRTAGLSRAANVFRETSHTTSRSMLKTLRQRDANLADTFRESLLSFQEIEAFDEETLRLVLDHTGDCQWAMALKGSSEKLRQRVLASLSAPVAKALQDEMSSVGPVRLSEITAAQSQVIDAILALDTDHQVPLSKRETGIPTSNRVSRAAAFGQ